MKRLIAAVVVLIVVIGGAIAALPFLVSSESVRARIIEQAALADEPHRIAFYLHELASELHSHWNRGKEMPELRFINPKNAKLTLARMALLQALSDVLASGLSIVGASAPEEMR